MRSVELPFLFLIVATLIVATAEPASARAQPGDREIATAIELELMSQGLTIAHSLDVSARNGIVTLTGAVDSLLDVERALEVARATRGVRSVVSRIAIEAVERTDAELVQEARRRLARDPATDELELEVSAGDGVVRLAGTVESWRQKRFATRLVQGVPGVRAVAEELVIDLGAPREDEDIADEIQRRLRGDVAVRHGLLEVDVRGGRVAVAGFVGSAAERERVHTDAWVRGVRSVDTSGLEVRPWAHDETKRLRPEPLPDDEIRAAIRDALVYDPRIAATEIEVEVENGVAVLRGVAETALAKREAGEIARNTRSVARVRNVLKVRPPPGAGGEGLVARVRDALASEPKLGHEAIEVTDRYGRIYLDGWVDGARERQRATAAAEGVAGVLEVRNRLDVPRASFEQTDRELREAIEEQLFWDARIDETEVRVEVEDGVATLRGAVDDWTQRERAAENAFEAGAVKVRNRIGVRILAPEDARA